jgi:hypothetical protein
VGLTRFCFFCCDFWVNYKDNDRYKNFVLNGIHKLLGTTTFNYIESLSINYTQQINIKKYGFTKILKVEIFGNLPRSSPTDFYVLFNNIKSEILILPLAKIYFVKSNLKEKEYFIGGLTLNRNLGFFNIYSYKNGKFVKNFKDEDAPLVFLNSLDCVRLKNNYLSLKNNDVNEYGYLNVVFSGTLEFYCKPHEFGVDLKDRKSIKSRSINYICKYNPLVSMWLPPKTISFFSKIKKNTQNK